MGWKRPLADWGCDMFNPWLWEDGSLMVWEDGTPMLLEDSTQSGPVPLFFVYYAMMRGGR